MTRLRRAISVASSSYALGGNQIYVGHYTGSTVGAGLIPVSKSSKDRRLIRVVAAELRNVSSEMVRLLQATEESQVKDPSLRWEFPDPHASELITRWDMQDRPPDILITNTVMLNVMLMRDLEAPIFRATQDWLRSDPENAITLVVDELHGYRGTQGSEVALILRKLYLEMELEILVVPGAEAAEEAGRLVEHLPELWREADLAERHGLLLTMLDGVYVDARESRSIVMIRPKAQFRAVFWTAITREWSGVELIRYEPLENSPEAHINPCSWWRRGRVELSSERELTVMLAA